jgi:acetyl esterase/lipase
MDQPVPLGHGIMSTTAASQASEKNKIVKVRRETDLSLLYRVLRVVVRPLRPRLVKPGKPAGAGSPRLFQYPRFKRDFFIKEQKHEASGLWLYNYEPLSGPNIKVKPPSTIYYFAGGGFQSPPARAHWRFLGRLAERLMLDHHITVVSYGLAPNTPAAAALPQLRTFVAAAVAEAAARHTTVTLMGDSAGGNVALGLAFWWAAEVAAASEDRALRAALERVVVLSPPVDLRCANPAMAGPLDRRDPLLGAAFAKTVADAWVAAPPTDAELISSPDDPYISPVNHSPETFRLLAELGIEVHGVYGTCDVLAPDIEIFQRKCKENGVRGAWLVWEGQMHCFVLAGSYGMREGRKATDWLVKLLKGGDDLV